MTPPTPTRTCSECKEVHPAGSKPWGCTLQVWMCRRCQHRLRQRAARQSSPRGTYQINDRPSPMHDDILSFIHLRRSLTGRVPNLQQIADGCQVGTANPVQSVRYHLKVMIDRGFIERRLGEAVLAQKAKAPAQPEPAKEPVKRGAAKRQGSCPERAASIVRLLQMDEHAIDRLAHAFKRGVL